MEGRSYGTGHDTAEAQLSPAMTPTGPVAVGEIPGRSEAGYVAPATHRLALERIHRRIHAAPDLGHPRQPIMEDPLDSTLQGGCAHRARAASTLELHLDHPGGHVGEQERQIPPVGLDRRAHELDEAVELAQPLRPLVVGQRRRLRPRRRSATTLRPRRRWPGRCPPLLDQPSHHPQPVLSFTTSGRPSDPVCPPHQSALSERSSERGGTIDASRASIGPRSGLDRAPRRWRRWPTVAVTMRCAHGPICDSPGADWTRPSHLRAGHGSAMGTEPGTRVGTGGRRPPCRSDRRGDRTLPPGRADGRRRVVGLRPPVLERTVSGGAVGTGRRRHIDHGE